MQTIKEAVDIIDFFFAEQGVSAIFFFIGHGV